MNPYTSALATMEGELQALDQRRAKLIAALGSLRALDDDCLPLESVPPPKATKLATNERTNERTKQARGQGRPAGASLR